MSFGFKSEEEAMREARQKRGYTPYPDNRSEWGRGTLFGRKDGKAVNKKKGRSR